MTHGTAEAQSKGRGVGIPGPMAASSGMTTSEIARWHQDMALLAADPRTAGSANRPKWLVERVLREGRTAKAVSR